MEKQDAEEMKIVIFPMILSNVVTKLRKHQKTISIVSHVNMNGRKANML